MGGAIAIDNSDNIYLADGINNRVREISAEDGIINTIAGNGIPGYSGDGGPPLLAELNAPSGVVLYDSGNIYISEQGNNRVRLITKHPLVVNNFINMEQDINVYPNPCRNYCTMKIISAINEQADVVISNITGALLYKYSIFTNQPFNFQTDLPPGIYFIKATTKQQQLYQKLMIQ